jgi:hypothetical protein
MPATTAERKMPNEPNFHPQPKENKSHPHPPTKPDFTPAPHRAAPPSPLAPLVILAFPMLSVRFAPSPTGLLHIGLEALGRATCLRRIEHAIRKLKTS